MCKACKQYGILPQFESAMHPEYETLLNEIEREVALPKGLPAIEHFAVLKKPDASKALVADAAPSKMTQEAMNPGYFNVAGDALIIAPKLQQGLSGLLTTKYKKYLRGDKPSAGDALSVALVDLTGKKLAAPELAGWGSTVAWNAASTGKIVFLYAVHQLRFDLEILLNRQGVKSLGEAIKAIGTFQRKFGLPHYNLSWSKIFDYSFSGGRVMLSFSSSLANTIVQTFKLNNNSEASRLLHHASYPYVGSLLWQSGLRRPAMGGLWITNGYGGVGGPWTNAPSVGPLVSTHNTTALSTATFFTLMAQGRLVSDGVSRQIKETLRSACTFFWRGVIGSKTGITKRPPAKCGIWSKFYNDVILVEYEDGRCRYVACVLTTLSEDKNFLLQDIIADLDDLVRKNNP